MKQVYDLATIRRTLRDGIAKGYWTEEHFDTPSIGRRTLEEEMKHHKVVELRSFQLPPHRNLLRDHHPEAVEVISPRDFEPAQADPEPLVRSPSAPVHVPGEESSGVDDFCPEF